MFSFSGGYCFESTDYITIDKFLDKHPEQKSLMENFSKIVSEKPVPLGIRMRQPVKIAVIYPGLQKSNYWRDSVKSMEARLKELSINYNLQVYYSKPSGDYRLQVKQLSEAIKDESDYISISVDNENIKRLVSSILSKGEPKIFIQNLTTPLKDWDTQPPYMYVGFDHIVGAKIIAEHYAKLFPGGASYILLYGSKGTVSTLRGGGFEGYGLSKGFVPVAKYYTDFNSDKAYQATKNSLKKFPNISFVYACSTDIALGASKAIEEMGLLGKVQINGWGGTINELDLIKEKKLNFTVMRMNDDNGIAIAEGIKADLLNKTKLTPMIFSGEFVTVTSDMTNQQIDTLIERALRYSGK